VHAVAFAFEGEDFGMMQKAVQNRGGEGAVVIEDLGPVFKGLVGGQNNRAALKALADDLNEQIDSGFVDGKLKA
jgi:hypothetical protein